MTEGREGLSPQARVLRSLPFRVVVFLALALLPIGLLAIWQTRDLAIEARGHESLNVLALTELAAADKRQVFERAFGAAEALGSVFPLISEDPASCSAFLAEYRVQSDNYSFVGYLPANQVVQCTSAQRTLDFRDTEDVLGMFAEPRPVIVRIDEPAESPHPVLSIFQPFFDEDAFSGYVTLSIPQERIKEGNMPLSDVDEITFVTFDARGGLLTAEDDGTLDEGVLPRVPLADLTNGGRYTFEGMGQDGIPHLYAVVPLVDDVAYSLSIWPSQGALGPSLASVATSALFPMLMWLASLLVAYLAVHRLVVGQVRALSQQMRRFAAQRELPSRQRRTTASVEFAELEDTFVKMSYDLIEDEAKMEDALREKNVLLKEVHHRVKNNLQMISSIMNMQIRTSDSLKTRSILQRLQDRILGLATVHRHLYQADDLAKTDAGELLREVARNQFEAVAEDQDIYIETHFDPIVMFPDQALPLSLLVNEMSTNAVKYVSAPDGEQRQIRLTLDRREDDGTVDLRCWNTKTAQKSPEMEALSGTGLGNQLIRAFALQLGATPVVEETDDSYAVSVNFAVADFKPAPLDY